MSATEQEITTRAAVLQELLAEARAERDLAQSRLDEAVDLLEQLRVPAFLWGRVAGFLLSVRAVAEGNEEEQ